MAASHALAMGPALMRRFCSCDFTAPCRCGQEPPKSGWTVHGLAHLWDLMKEHGSLAIAAQLLDRTQHDCNIALDALLGATPAHALARLEARVERR